MAKPSKRPQTLHISAAALQKLEDLADALQLPPDVIVETAAVLLETLLSYNRKGYSRATLKHAIFRNANKEIDIDIPAAADYYHQKSQKERQMSEALDRQVSGGADIRVGHSQLSEAPSGSMETRLVDMQMKIDAIASALKILHGDAWVEPRSDDDPSSGRLAGSALAELEDLTHPLADDAALEADETGEMEPADGTPEIKPPANPLTRKAPRKPAVKGSPPKATGAAAFAHLDYSGEEEAAPEPEA